NTITWQELHENGAANGLKPENGQLLQEFEAIKTAILKATSKRGHTPRQESSEEKFNRDSGKDIADIIYKNRVVNAHAVIDLVDNIESLCNKGNGEYAALEENKIILISQIGNSEKHREHNKDFVDALIGKSNLSILIKNGEKVNFVADILSGLIRDHNDNNGFKIGADVFKKILELNPTHAKKYILAIISAAVRYPHDRKSVNSDVLLKIVQDILFTIKSEKDKEKVKIVEEVLLGLLKSDDFILSLEAMGIV
ncbi:MAG: hypothetical protein GY820_10950, partial [Gammaproteobacteria bacterium]|nr:hypothetical protein [Gammaproteobacteria bacterium]